MRASTNHWACEIAWLGHDVQLIPNGHIKAVLPRQKNDAADAYAIARVMRCGEEHRPTGGFDAIQDTRSSDLPGDGACECTEGPLRRDQEQELPCPPILLFEEQFSPIVDYIH